MSKKTLLSVFYNFLCFALLYTVSYFLIISFTNLTGLWIPVTSAVIASILSPKFQSVKTANGEKLFMKWIFMKDIRELK